ncbi:cytochrome b/b6 domain-containing protein [Chiayiivirga flava]
MSRSVEARHDPVARRLHWIVAIVLPMQFVLGCVAERASSRQIADAALAWHVQLGVVLLALTLMRLGWRLWRRIPTAVHVADPRQRIAARCVHGSLYVLLLALPAAGYVIVVWMGEDLRLLGLVDMPRVFTPPADDETGRAIAWYVHVYGAWFLVALIAMHVAAAAWHRRAKNSVSTSTVSGRRTRNVRARG